jgi:hypothetical protein
MNAPTVANVPLTSAAVGIAIYASAASRCGAWLASP